MRTGNLPAIIKCSFRITALLLLLLAACIGRAEETPGLTVPVIALDAPPHIDGDVAEWSRYQVTHSLAMELTPTFTDNANEVSASADWYPKPTLWAGVYRDRVYFAVTWRDERASVTYKPWKRHGPRYGRSRTKDDLFAMRFHTGGVFNACMVVPANYTVDLWQWSAGRSNLVGTADDMTHIFSTKRIELAAEYRLGDEIMYIRKERDPGTSGYRYVRKPKEIGPPIVLGVELEGTPSGSRADVTAKGVWRDGVWTLEFSRALDTGDPNDIVFIAGGNVLGQLAIFNAGYNSRKRVSQELLFDLSEIQPLKPTGQ